MQKGDDDKVPDTLTDWQEAEARYLSSSGGLSLRNKKPAAAGERKTKTKTNRNNLGVILMAPVRSDSGPAAADAKRRQLARARAALNQIEANICWSERKDLGELFPRTEAADAHGRCP
jgi:hypothetical protein